MEKPCSPVFPARSPRSYGSDGPPSAVGLCHELGNWGIGVRVPDLTPDSDPIPPSPRWQLADPTALTQKKRRRPQKLQKPGWVPEVVPSTNGPTKGPVPPNVPVGRFLRFSASARSALQRVLRPLLEPRPMYTAVGVSARTLPPGSDPIRPQHRRGVPRTGSRLAMAQSSRRTRLT